MSRSSWSGCAPPAPCQLVLLERQLQRGLHRLLAALGERLPSLPPRPRPVPPLLFLGAPSGSNSAHCRRRRHRCSPSGRLGQPFSRARPLLRRCPRWLDGVRRRRRHTKLRKGKSTHRRRQIQAQAAHEAGASAPNSGGAAAAEAWECDEWGWRAPVVKLHAVVPPRHRRAQPSRSSPVCTHRAESAAGPQREKPPARRERSGQRTVE